LEQAAFTVIEYLGAAFFPGKFQIGFPVPEDNPADKRHNAYKPAYHGNLKTIDPQVHCDCPLIQ